MLFLRMSEQLFPLPKTRGAFSSPILNDNSYLPLLEGVCASLPLFRLWSMLLGQRLGEEETLSFLQSLRSVPSGTHNGFLHSRSRIRGAARSMGGHLGCGEIFCGERIKRGGAAPTRFWKNVPAGTLWKIRDASHQAMRGKYPLSGVQHRWLLPLLVAEFLFMVLIPRSKAMHFPLLVGYASICRLTTKIINGLDSLLS